MEDWEVWDLAVDEKLKQPSKNKLRDETNNSSSDHSKDEIFERSTSISVRTSHQDLSGISPSSSPVATGYEDDSLLEEVKITYVFKEQRTKSSDNLLTRSCDHSPRRSRNSFRQSLRERLSLNFNSNDNKNTDTYDKKNKGKNNNSVHGNRLTVENVNSHNNQINMISRSKSLDCLQSKNNVHNKDEVCFPFEENHNGSAGVAQTKRHFSATRSDLTSVGLQSDDDDDDCNRLLSVFSDSDEVLNLDPSEGNLSPKITTTHNQNLNNNINSSTPKKTINRSRSQTDIKKVGKSDKGEDVYLLSVLPRLGGGARLSGGARNMSKSLESIHKMDKKDIVKDPAKPSKSPGQSPVVRRKARTYSDSTFKIDSGYFSPDDLRKDSEASSTTALDVANATPSTAYTITFTPEKSNTNNEPSTPVKQSPSIRQGLGSVLPLGVGETMVNDERNAENIIHNAESAHSVEEHGTFNLRPTKQDELRLSFTEEEEYVDIDYLIEEEDPTMDSYDNETTGDRTEERTGDEIEGNTKLTENIEDLEEYEDFKNGLKDAEKKQQMASDEVDCPKYRMKTPPLLTIIHPPEEEEEEANKLPVNDSEDKRVDGFQIMHSTYPEINNDEGDPSFDESYCDDDMMLRGVGVSGVESLTPSTPSPPERYRTISSSNECNSPFEDSMKSFEAHEREYASINGGGTPSTTGELTEDEEDSEWEHVGDHRRMTFVLLDYLPPIVEEDKAPSTCSIETAKDDESRPDSARSNNRLIEYPRTLSAENLRLHNKDNKEVDTVKKNILEDFLSCSTSDDHNLHEDDHNLNEDDAEKQKEIVGSNDLDVTDTISTASDKRNDNTESTGSITEMKNEDSDEEKLTDKEHSIVPEKVFDLEGKPPSPTLAVLDGDLNQGQPKEADTTEPQKSHSTTSPLSDNDEASVTPKNDYENILYPSNQPPTESPGKVSPVAKTEALFDEKLPLATTAPPTILIDSVADNDRSVEEGDGEPLTPTVLRKDVNFNSRYSFTFSDLEDEQEEEETKPSTQNQQEQNSNEKLSSDDVLPAADISILMEDIRFANMEEQKDLIELSGTSAVLSKDDFKIANRDETELKGLEDSHLKPLDEEVKESNVDIEPNENYFPPALNEDVKTYEGREEEREKENTEDAKTEAESKNLKEDGIQDPGEKTENRAPLEQDDKELTLLTQAQVETLTDTSTDLEVNNNDKSSGSHTLQQTGDDVQTNVADTSLVVDTIDLTEDNDDEFKVQEDPKDQDEDSDTVEEIFSSIPRSLVHIPRQATIEEALRSNQMKGKSDLRRDSSMAWDDFQTNYDHDEDKEDQMDDKNYKNYDLNLNTEQSLETDDTSSEQKLVIKSAVDDNREKIEDIHKELPNNSIETISTILREVSDRDQCLRLLNNKISRSSKYADFYVELSTSKQDLQKNDNQKSGYKLYTILSQDDCQCSFKRVINDCLCYLGLVKSEHPIPGNINVQSLLVFFTNLIEENEIDVKSTQMFLYFLIKPSTILNRYHDERMKFVTSCFHSEMRHLKRNDDKDSTSTRYSLVLPAFQKICTCFVHLDVAKSKELVDSYVSENLTSHNTDQFILDVFMFMDILKSETPIPLSTNKTAPLSMLNHVIDSFPVPLSQSTRTILLAFLGEQVAWKYHFSNNARKSLYNKLFV